METNRTSDSLSIAERDVIAERRRQVSVEGWTARHDDQHDRGQLATAAACYAAPHAIQWSVRWWHHRTATLLWPWHARWWKPTSNRRGLVKAAALIIAEIERLDRRQNYVPDYRDDSELDT